jgi:hypothetical protein
MRHPYYMLSSGLLVTRTHVRIVQSSTGTSESVDHCYGAGTDDEPDTAGPDSLLLTTARFDPASK